MRWMGRWLGYLVLFLCLLATALIGAWWWHSTTTTDRWVRLDEPNHLEVVVSCNGLLYWLDVRRGENILNLPGVAECEDPPTREIARRYEQERLLGKGLFLSTDYMLHSSMRSEVRNQAGKADAAEVVTLYSTQQILSYAVHCGVLMVLTGLAPILFAMQWIFRRVRGRTATPAPGSGHA